MLAEGLDKAATWSEISDFFGKGIQFRESELPRLTKPTVIPKMASGTILESPSLVLDN